MKTYEVELVANEHCGTGENPLWHAQTQQLIWTDIPRGRMFRLETQSGTWSKIYDGPQVGGFTLQADDNLLLFRTNEFVILKADGSEKIVTQIPATTGRFNDVVADPEGRVFAGTMGLNDKTSGGLFRVDTNGNATQLFAGTGCANGSGWSPDFKNYYWTDSTARIIYQFDYVRASGEISNRQIWKSFEEKDGIPDGMKVDVEGCIWEAFYGASCVRRFSPSGELLAVVNIPAPSVTCCAFGGADLQTLYVTTAGGEDTSQTLDGALFKTRVDVAGKEEYRSRVGL